MIYFDAVTCPKEPGMTLLHNSWTLVEMQVGTVVLIGVDQFVALVLGGVVTRAEMEIVDIAVDVWRLCLGFFGEAVEGKTTMGVQREDVLIEVVLVPVGVEEEMTTTVVQVMC